MSEIDFQNGFLCGLATRGLVTNENQLVRFIEVFASDGYNASLPMSNVFVLLSDSVSTSFPYSSDSSISDTFDVTSIINSLSSSWSDTIGVNIT